MKETKKDTRPDTKRFQPSDPVLACNMAAIPEEVRVLKTGYALRLANETDLLQTVGAFFHYERLCCPFFHFKLEMEPDQGCPVRSAAPTRWATSGKMMRWLIMRYVRREQADFSAMENCPTTSPLRWRSVVQLGELLCEGNLYRSITADLERDSSVRGGLCLHVTRC
jgi:hypothetical protein